MIQSVSENVNTEQILCAVKEFLSTCFFFFLVLSWVASRTADECFSNRAWSIVFFFFFFSPVYAGILGSLTMATLGSLLAQHSHMLYQGNYKLNWSDIFIRSV